MERNRSALLSLATAARAAALNAAGHLAIMHGDLDAAAAPLDQSLSIRRDLADAPAPLREEVDRAALHLP